MKLSEQHKQALRDYRDRHGRKWKRQLYNYWISGMASGVLQQLRNSRDFGPAGLARLRPADLTSNCRLWVRCGDSDSYREFGDGLDDAFALADYLREMEVGAFVEWRAIGMGMETENCQGNNYVSIFWGDDQAQPVRDLTANEQRAIVGLMGSNA